MNDYKIEINYTGSRNYANGYPTRFVRPYSMCRIKHSKIALEFQRDTIVILLYW